LAAIKKKAESIVKNGTLMGLTVLTVAAATGAVLYVQNQRAAKPAVVASADADAAAEVVRLREENARLRREGSRAEAADPSERVRLRKEVADFKRLLAQAEREQEALKKERDRLAMGNEGKASPASAGEPTATNSQRRLRVEFGETESPEALVNLDLSKVSQASRTLNEVGVLLMGAEGKGAAKSVWNEVGGDYKRARQDLSLLGYAMRGQLPTFIEGGESTHPLVTANLVFETLEDQDMPLDDDQVSQIALLGDDYERARQRLVAGYNETTLALARIIDELELRRTFSEALDSVLTDEQLEALGPVEVRYMAHLDFQSVAVALGEVSGVLPYGAPEDLRSRLESVTQSLGIGDEHLPTIAFVIDDWAATPGLAVPVAENELKFYQLDVAIAAGRAQQRAMESMVRVLASEAEIVAALRGHQRFVVPRLAPGWEGGRGGK
jgi:hypothetical protein